MELWLCHLVETFLSLELRLLDQQNIRLQEQKAKILLVGLRGNSKWCHSYFHLLILGPVVPRYLRNRTIFWVLIQNIQPSKEPSPALLGIVS